MTDTEFRTAIRGLTKAQREALDRVALNDDFGTHHRTWKVLERRGLVEGKDQILGGRLPIRIRRHYMPIHVHIQWCAWCSERVERGEITS